MYWDSNVKRKWDNENVLQYAIQQAVEQTKTTILKEIAKKMKDRGYPVTDISEITSLSVEEIEKL